MLLLLGVTAVFSQAQSPSDADVPVAPIAATEFKGWTNALILQNSTMKVIVIPEVGRIVHLAHKNQQNLLRLNESLQGHLPDPEGKETWTNIGGDWFWPVAQSHWTMLADSDWPPPAPLAEQPWTGRAWKSADGAQHCLISREYGKPLNLKVSRQITLDKSEAQVRIRQRIERTGESDIPVTLWNITQLAAPEQVILPLDKDLPRKDGLKALMGNLPRKPNLTRCDGSVIYDTSSGERKIGALSERAWIAARKGNFIILETAKSEDEEQEEAGDFPDGGCAVEMYSNTGLGYTEIETLSREQTLKPNESMQNLLTIQVVNLTDKSQTNCATINQVRRAIEETGKTKNK